MTTQLLGGLILPLLFAGGLGYLVFRSRAGKLRRVTAVAPGRVVIAANLVNSRRR
ncbi:MAG TPA: hypothetical protein VEM76_15500 [Anaeromyxobacteraceae bacterium]|nr:hypothetical protein [Anaeromyxobacteraceae bacterium]